MNFESSPIWRCALLAGLAFLAVTTAASAADKLDVILVKAANEGTSDAALKDYLPLLTRSGFKSYQTVVRRQVALAAGDVALAQGFQATLGEVGGRRVPVTISRNGKDLIRTTVSFSPGRPVVLGTYDGEGGAKLLIILVLSAT